MDIKTTIVTMTIGVITSFYQQIVFDLTSDSMRHGEISWKEILQKYFPEKDLTKILS